MKTVKQISIFLENKPGQLMEFTKLLSDSNIDMRTLTLAEASEFGIVRVIVNNTEKAEASLKEAGYVSAITQVIAVVVPDRPGGLYGVLKLLSDQNINIDYTYAFTGKKGEGAYNILHVSPEDTQAALDVLDNSGIRIVPQEELDAL